MVLKQRSPALRHVSRPHRVCLAQTYEVMQSPCTQLKYVNTGYQIADMMAKASDKQELFDALSTLSALRSSSERGNGEALAR